MCISHPLDARVAALRAAVGCGWTYRRDAAWASFHFVGRSLMSINAENFCSSFEIRFHAHLWGFFPEKVRFVPVVPIRKIGVGTGFSRIYQAFLVNVPFVPIIFNLRVREKNIGRCFYIRIYIKLVKNRNNWNKWVKPQVNRQKSCSNSKNGVGTGFSESRKTAGKQGKVLFQLFWNKLEQNWNRPRNPWRTSSSPADFSGGASELFWIDFCP